MVRTRERELLYFEDGSPAPEHRALDHVTQLANVAGPGIRQQQLAGRGADLSHGATVLGIENPEEVLGEEHDVFPPLAQWWDVEHDHGEPEIEIRPESFALHLPLEITVGRRDDPHVDLALADAAHPPNRAVFDGAQQLSLHREIDVP